jgi:hypothetical protein
LWGLSDSARFLLRASNLDPMSLYSWSNLWSHCSSPGVGPVGLPCSSACPLGCPLTAFSKVRSTGSTGCL